MLAASLLAAPPASASAAVDTGGRSSAFPADSAPAVGPQGAQAQEEASALAEAARTGKPVPIPSRTTETETVVANPNGTLGLTRSVAPARVRQNGVWVDLDPTLTTSPDGRLRPKAVSSEVTFSAGGTSPLVALESAGQNLALTWPKALPAPRLEGDSALYPNVLPDVDLKVTATSAGGFSQVLVVKTPQAAANPQLASLSLGMDSEALSVRTRPDGGLEAADANGRAVFSAAAPVMWDSGTVAAAPVPTTKQAGTLAAAAAPEAQDGTASGSDSEGPGAGAKVAPVAATASGDTLELRPDAGMLADPATRFPVYIDPTWNPVSKGSYNWTWVQSGLPDHTGNHNNTTTKWDIGVGYQQWAGGPIGLERAYVQVPVKLGDPSQVQVRFATFNMQPSGASDNGCDNKHDVNLYLVSAFQPWSWNSKPADSQYVATASLDSRGVDDDDPACKNANAHAGWDITGLVRTNQNWDNLTFGVYSSNEAKVASNVALKRFSRKQDTTHWVPFLYAEINRRPSTPIAMSSDPWPTVLDPASSDDNPFLKPTWGCPTQSTGFLGRTNLAGGGVWLHATVADPDQTLVNGRFSVSKDHPLNPPVAAGTTPSVASGQSVAWSLGNQLEDGHTYYWSAKSEDGTWADGSDWAAPCAFTVDMTPPDRPSVASTDFPPSGSGQVPQKFAYTNGAFTFTAQDATSGVAFYEYAMNDAIPLGGGAKRKAAASGTTINLRADRWGTNILYVQAVDQAGNRSQPTAYAFYAPFDPAAKPVIGDITADKQPDLVAPAPNGDLRIYTTAGDTANNAGGTLAATAAASPNDVSWTGIRTTHAGGNGNINDNLWAHAPGAGLLRHYANAPKAGEGYFPKSARTDVTRPVCAGPQCATYAPDWSRVQQILAIGEVDRASIGDERGTDRYDLLTVEDDGNGNHQLWLFHGSNGAGGLEDGTVQLITASGWNNTTLIGPGDTNGDRFPDLWVRNTNTGDVFEYPSRTVNGVFDASAYADTTKRLLVGVGYTASRYPLLSSERNLDKDDANLADLWGMSGDGRVSEMPGRVPDSANPYRFHAPRPIIDTAKASLDKQTFNGIEINGAILFKYRALGGPNGLLGNPKAPAAQTVERSGWYVNFDRGAIYWSIATGAWEVHGPLGDKWAALQWERSPLGYPVSDWTPITGNGTGQFFQNGGIYWDGNTASSAKEVHGAVHTRYLAMGGAAKLGYPTTDEQTTPDGAGRYNHFAGDTASIYWSAETGAWPISGAFRAWWAGQGWERAWVGYPVSYEYSAPGGVKQNFRYGYLYWNQATGAVTATSW